MPNLASIIQIFFDKAYTTSQNLSSGTLKTIIKSALKEIIAVNNNFSNSINNNFSNNIN